VTHKISDTPSLPKPANLVSFFNISIFLIALVRALQNILSTISYTLNRTLSLDGTDAMAAPIVVKTFTVATVPTAASWEAGIIYVSDETGGATLAFSDGSDWRRVQDYATIS
jgi:hypothetical protein